MLQRCSVRRSAMLPAYESMQYLPLFSTFLAFATDIHAYIITNEFDAISPQNSKESGDCSHLLVLEFYNATYISLLSRIQLDFGQESGSCSFFWIICSEDQLSAKTQNDQHCTLVKSSKAEDTTRPESPSHIQSFVATVNRWFNWQVVSLGAKQYISLNLVLFVVLTLDRAKEWSYFVKGLPWLPSCSQCWLMQPSNLTLGYGPALYKSLVPLRCIEMKGHP